MKLGTALLAVASVGLGCVSPDRPPSAIQAAGSLGAALPVAAVPVSAAEAFARGDCNRCHHVPAVTDAIRQDSCIGCHVWIRDVSQDPARRDKARSVFPLWDRYEANVASYLEVPSLEAAMARLDPDWVRGYLRDPHDLRPNLPETMPRFALGEAEIEAIVGTFEQALVEVTATPAPDSARVEAGRALFVSRGCVACHTAGAEHTLAAVPMAPDLAHTRHRMSPDRIVAWIVDPQAISSSATMPTLGVSRDDAVKLRDYLVLADLSAPAEPAPTGLPAPTTEPVTWEDVESRVFGKICVHCHMNPDLNQGRAGPGNAGGFGWPATGIELQTWEGVVAVADKLPGVLARRRQEIHRDLVRPGHSPAQVDRPDKPGMPLGLPALSDDDTALVLGWIAQGTPR